MKENEINEINGLADLRRRKRELLLEMKITRQSLFQSLRQTRREARRAFVNGVLVPLGVGSIASVVFNSRSGDGSKPDWLLFAEQAIHTMGQFFDSAEKENGQAAEDKASS